VLLPPQDVVFGNRGTWSPDGRTLVLQSPGDAAGTGVDLRAVVFKSVEVIGHEAPAISLLAASRFNEFSPAFSPDGRWVAYQSDESGRGEIYVRPFPGPGAQIQISRDGGSTPKWQGREIFYVQPDGSGKLIMAATVESQPELHVTGTKVALRSVNFVSFDVARDGRRFLLLVGTRHLPTQLNLILNWPTQLGTPRGR
jgi:serine/threonine-protein kinase